MTVDRGLERERRTLTAATLANGPTELIDFVLSNLVNGEVRQIAVLTQYKSHSLDRHISSTWRLSAMLGNYIAPVPAQQRLGPRWFAGSADAIYQSLNLIGDEQPDYVIVFGADHIYRMDPSQMMAQHIESGAGVTVAAIRQPIGLADQFGVIDVDPQDPRRIREFLEKPTTPQGLPDSPDEVFASMGNYVFTADALVAAWQAPGASDGQTEIAIDIYEQAGSVESREMTDNSAVDKGAGVITGLPPLSSWPSIDRPHLASFSGSP